MTLEAAKPRPRDGVLARKRLVGREWEALVVVEVLERAQNAGDAAVEAIFGMWRKMTGGVCQLGL